MIKENAGTIFVGIVLLLTVGIIIFRMIKERKNNNTSCSCGCGCSDCCTSCSSKNRS